MQKTVTSKWIGAALGALMAFNVSVAGAATLTNHQVQYKTYHNERFRYSVQYPSSWKLGPRPNDGDGRAMYTPSGVSSFDNGYGTGWPNIPKSDVLLQVVGTVNAIVGVGAGQNFNQMVAAIKKQLPQERKQPGFMSEKYTIVPNKWIIETLVLRIGHGGVEYSKIVTSLDTNQSVSMTYPISEAKVYAPFWTHIEKSFVPGNGKG